MLVELFGFLMIFTRIDQANLSQCGHLITDFSQQTCIDKDDNENTYFYSKEDCIPECKMFEKEGHEGDRCPCPPGYICEKRCQNSKKSCQQRSDCGSREGCIDMCTTVPGKPLCMAYYANTFEYRETYYSAQRFKPACTDSGDWKPKQCKGGVGGRCFCFDSVGNRLFGQATYTESHNMTCACSRRKADLLAQGSHYVSLHCDEKGNYEELQCNDGLCWCAEPMTGKLISPVVPEKVMNRLPCYKIADVGGQYLRKCDSVKYAYSYTERILRNHGMIYVNMGEIQCDGDGAFGKYNLSGSIARCTWRDGTQIGAWQSDASTDISQLTCNCARDYKMYQHQLVCDGSGNYLAVQTVVNDGKNSFYCVDNDGFPKTDFFDARIDNCTKYY